MTFEYNADCLKGNPANWFSLHPNIITLFLMAFSMNIHTLRFITLTVNPQISPPPCFFMMINSFRGCLCTDDHVRSRFGKI